MLNAVGENWGSGWVDTTAELMERGKARLCGVRVAFDGERTRHSL